MGKKLSRKSLALAQIISAEKGLSRLVCGLSKDGQGFGHLSLR